MTLAQSASTPALSPARPMGGAPILPTTVQRNRLTPRSAEACRRTGIEPSELLPLPLEAFREPGQRPEVEKKRMERYEQLRVEAYQTVRAERDRILKETGDATPFVGNATMVASSSSGKLKHAKTSGSAAKLEEQASAQENANEAAELRALERIKKKQQAEIEQMLMFEIRAAQLAQEKQEKVAALQAADAREKADRAMRQKQAAEARMKQELERKEAEVAAERDSRRRQRADMEQQMRRQAAEEEAERVLLRARGRRERERAAKQAARREKQEQLYKQQQDEAYAKQELDAEREAARLARLEEKRQRAAEEMQVSRERAQRRIALTMQMKEERSEQQRYVLPGSGRRPPPHGLAAARLGSKAAGPDFDPRFPQHGSAAAPPLLRRCSAAAPRLLRDCCSAAARRAPLSSVSQVSMPKVFNLSDEGCLLDTRYPLLRPPGLIKCVRTMRLGEKCRVTLLPEQAFGAAGDESMGVPEVSPLRARTRDGCRFGRLECAPLLDAASSRAGCGLRRRLRLGISPDCARLRLSISPSECACV